MVKLAKAAKGLGKPKKAAPPPPKDVDDSEEEDSEEEEDGSSEEEAVPQKKAVTPAKASGTPGKKGATPGKKGATPAKPMITPGKKAVAAKNGKKAQKKDSDEDDDEEEEEEEDEDESESEEETPPAKKPTPKKPAAKPEKPSKKKAAKKEESDEEDDDEDDEEDDDSEDAMDTTPAPAKVKPAAVEAKESSDEDEEDDDEDEDDEDEEEKVTVKDSGKRKKEVPKQNTASEAKKPKTEGAESFSLFVGNLNAEKDFDELKDAIRNFFTKKNLTVSDVRLGQTKKFGYVDFSTEEDLEKAVELSGKKILGVETKMEKARSKEHNIESKKERNLRTIFVKNLPYSTTSETLQELFENAVDVRLPVGGDGSSRGIAYIEFKSEAEAEKALEERQGADVDGRTIILDFTGDKAGKTSGDQKVLVINNLAYSVTESALQEVFEKAVSCKIPQNNQGRPKGFAFVEFTSIEDCKEALKTHNNTEIEGRAVRLELKGAQQGGRGAGSGQSKTLFVRGLSEDTTEESLREAFDGAVGSRIATDRETGSSKGFGFVDFSTVEDAKAAKEAMEDGEIDGNKVTLDFAKPKGDGGRGGFGRGGGGRGFGRGRGFGGGYGGGRGGGGGGGRGGGGRGGGRGFGGGYGGGRGGGGGGFRGGNRGKKIRFDD